MNMIPMSGGGETDTDPLQNPDKELRRAADAPEGATGSEIMASGGDPLAASKTLTGEQKADIATAMRAATGTMRSNAKQGNDPDENVKNIEEVMGSGGADDNSPTNTDPRDSPTSESDNKRSDKGKQDTVASGDETGREETLIAILDPGKADPEESPNQGAGIMSNAGALALAGVALAVALFGSD